MRAFVWVVCVVVALVASACGGCSDPCDDVSCVNGTCVDGECVAATCDPACGPDEACRSGLCIPTSAQCEAAGELCNALGEVNDPFICLDLDGFGTRPGVCVEPCGANGQCAPGSLCFYLSSNAPASCSSSDDCGEYEECSAGACLRTICRPSECDGFLDNETCDALYQGVAGYADGSHCYNVGNGARYCYPAGPRGEGDSCGNPFDAIIADNFANTCAAGLACVDNVCQVACQDDTVCGDLQCILVEQNLVDVGTGICGSSCTPFEVGSCGAGQTCLAVSATEGVCAPAGDREAFEPCEPGLGQCADGNVCVTFQNDPVVAQCQPACNLTVGAPNDNGTVGELAQAQRDATCPQGEVPQANLAFTNLAEVGAAVDVYVGGALFAGAVSLDTSTSWAAIAPGATAIRVLPAGAPSTDPSLAEQTLSLTGGELQRLFILPTTSPDAVQLQPYDVSQSAPPAATSARLRVAMALPDASAVDVLLVPPGDDLSDPTTQQELATDVAVGAWSAAVEVVATDWDLLVFEANDPRTDRATALLSTNFTLTDQLDYTVALRGTLDPDDAAVAAVALIVDAPVPDIVSAGLAFTCVAAAGNVVGFCQQRCPQAGFDGRCEGEGVGCTPTFLSANNGWANLCAPLGDKSLDETCDPFAQYSECAEGMYCLEYGNTIPNYSALARGRCVSHCVDGEPDHPTLRCGAGQACAPLSAGFDIGQCGYACTPNDRYEDASCPVGLQACRPTAQLVEDAANPNALPTAVAAPSFCSASGDIASGDRCTGADCVPGTECMFPRSQQLDFTSSMLSQYFGASGLVPSCTPQCDPFDGDSSATTCGPGETCLFNYPYSAEVGHCAPIDVEVAPLAACSNPGHACGRDSICVVNGTPTCFQFCQYRGPDGAGQPRPETCAAGLVCAPLVNDIGVCLSPN